MFFKVVFPKTAVPRKKIKAINTPKEQLFGEISCSESHPCKCKCLPVALLKNLQYLINSCDYCCEIAN